MLQWGHKHTTQPLKWPDGLHSQSDGSITMLTGLEHMQGYRNEGLQK